MCWKVAASYLRYRSTAARNTAMDAVVVRTTCPSLVTQASVSSPVAPLRSASTNVAISLSRPWPRPPRWAKAYISRAGSCRQPVAVVTEADDQAVGDQRRQRPLPLRVVVPHQVEVGFRYDVGG